MDEPRAADHVARDLRYLADSLINADPDAAYFETLAPLLHQARSLVDDALPEHPSRDRVFADSSVFSGALNVNAPPLTLHRDESHDRPGLEGYPVLTAGATLGPRYEGPAEAVHGGIVSGMLDELLGATVSQIGSGCRAVTGKLNVRFVKPTPTNQPLTLQAWITEDRGRLVMAAATCGIEGLVTAKAEAMFIRLDRQ